VMVISYCGFARIRLSGAQPARSTCPELIPTGTAGNQPPSGTRVGFVLVDRRLLAKFAVLNAVAIV